MSNTDYTALEALAKAATPGPWIRLFGERTVYDRMEDGCRGIAIVRTDYSPPTKQEAANIDYIAATSPDVVLGLIEALRVAQAEIERQETIVKSWLRANAPGGWIDDLRAAGAAPQHRGCPYCNRPDYKLPNEAQPVAQPVAQIGAIADDCGVVKWLVHQGDPIALGDKLYAAPVAVNQMLLEALKDAIQTAEFESHPFRAWHKKARAAIKQAEGPAK